MEVSKSKSRAKMMKVIRRWQKIAKAAVGRSSTVPPDVPQGHMAVYASCNSSVERFVIPATYVNQPLFRSLLEKGEEVFGLNANSPIVIPCNPLIFHNHILPFLKKNTELLTWEIERLLTYACTTSYSSLCAISSSMASSAHSQHIHSAAASIACS